MQFRRATIYASSSQALAPEYYEAAATLGRVLAAADMEIIYGGGRYGLMGAMADAALAAGAKVEGVIPDFLMDQEVGHQGLSRLTVVGDLHTRKRLMLDGTDAVFCLPGGCGTFEEMFEAMTFKRLGLFLGPIVIINTQGYYNRCIEFLHQSTTERFMSQRHLDMWQVIESPTEALTALAEAPTWTEEERHQCALKPEGRV
jgi:uncharacterized protein (TIGR00730 family)